MLSKQRMRKGKQTDKQQRKKKRFGEGAKAWDADAELELQPVTQQTAPVPQKPKKPKVVVLN